MAAAFESEFPKLLRFFNDLWSRVAKFRVAIGSGGGGGETDGESHGEAEFEVKMKDAALKKFRDAYLARALSRQHKGLYRGHSSHS